jgi:hypothetical protein
MNRVTANRRALHDGREHGKEGRPGGLKAMKRATKARRPAKKSKHKARAVKDGAAIAMLRKGTTVPALMKAFGWTQPHTARGFISNLGRLHGFSVESSKEKGGVRTYKVR